MIGHEGGVARVMERVVKLVGDVAFENVIEQWVPQDDTVRVNAVVVDVRDEGGEHSAEKMDFHFETKNVLESE